MWISMQAQSSSRVKEKTNVRFGYFILVEVFAGDVKVPLKIGAGTG
jgi:hypothetical protein